MFFGWFFFCFLFCFVFDFVLLCKFVLCLHFSSPKKKDIRRNFPNVATPGAFPLKFYKDPNYKRDFTSVCMLLTLQAVRLICFPTQLFTSTIRALISFSFFFMHDASNRWRCLILDQSASSSSFARIRLQDVGQKGIFRCDLSEKRQIFTEKIRR